MTLDHYRSLGPARTPEESGAEEPLGVLGLSRRVFNALVNGGIRTVEDLQSYRSLPSPHLRGIGAQALAEIDAALASYPQHGLGAAGPSAERQAAPPPSPTLSADTLPSVTRPTQKPQTLHEALDGALRAFSERDRAVFSLRTGRDGAVATLQDIGEELGVTRERVRQLWKRAADRLVAMPWMRETRDRAAALLEGGIEAQYLDLIAIRDPWFEGFEGQLDYLGNLIELASHEQLRTLPLRGRLVLTRLSLSEWSKLCQVASETLRAQVAARLSRNDVALTVEAIAQAAGARDLTAELLAHLADSLHFTADPRSGEDVLMTVGQSYRAIVEGILRASPVPLTLRAIREEIRTLTGSTISTIGARAAIVQAGGFPLSGRRYGLLTHLAMSAPQQEQIRRIAEGLVAGAPSTRQWHAREITEAVLLEHPAWHNKLDENSVNAILHGSSVLDDLGRRIWKLRDGAPQSTESRLGIAELCVQLLSQAGRPMTTDELREAISQYRGLARQFQPEPNAAMVRLGSQLWGLVARDTGLSSDQGEGLLSSLEEHLRRVGREVKFSELEDLDFIGGNVTPHTAWDLAGQDPRFEVGSGRRLRLAAGDSSDEPSL